MLKTNGDDCADNSRRIGAAGGGEVSLIRRAAGGGRETKQTRAGGGSAPFMTWAPLGSGGWGGVRMGGHASGGEDWEVQSSKARSERVFPHGAWDIHPAASLVAAAGRGPRGKGALARREGSW